MSPKNLSLKGSMFPITVLDIADEDLSTLRSVLSAKVQAAPDFFDSAPLIIDCSQLDSDHIDFLRLKSLVAEAGMFLIGVSGINEAQFSNAKSVGLPIFKQIGKKRTFDSPATDEIANTANDANQDVDSPDKNASESSIVEKAANEQKPEANAPETPVPEATTAPTTTTSTYNDPMIINGIVRSGQRLYAEGRDMIVFGNVSPGAEVIADGNIHIYGRLRGRALAGAKGNHHAFICASSVQAELISIAGYYKVLEDDQAYHNIGVIKVTLDNSSLKFTPLEQV